MTSQILLSSHLRKQNILLDSNLLLLYFIGTYQTERIARFKRTQEFSPVHFDILLSLLDRFQTLLTTPHLLTEVNGLANALDASLKVDFSQHFASQLVRFTEILRPATLVTQETCFPAFGLADAAIQNLAADTLVLTQDGPLYHYLSAREIAVLHFKDLVG